MGGNEIEGDAKKPLLVTIPREKSTSLFVHTPPPNSKLRHRNSVSSLRDAFFSALPDKVRPALDPEIPFHLDLSRTFGLNEGEIEYYEKQVATLNLVAVMSSEAWIHVRIKRLNLFLDAMEEPTCEIHHFSYSSSIPNESKEVRPYSLQYVMETLAEYCVASLYVSCSSRMVSFNFEEGAATADAFSEQVQDWGG